MSIRQRLTSKVRLVSHFDDAFCKYVPEDLQEKYNQTLDIDVLGDLTRFKEQPSVVDCFPLLAKYEYLVNPPYTDYWGIFKYHVKAITGLDFELKFDGEAIDETMRKKLPKDFVINIASLIETLASRSSEDCFFTPPAGYSGYKLACKKRLAAENTIQGASMGAAINKS